MNPDATDASGNSTRPTPGYLVLRPPVRATQQETATSRKIEAKLSGKAGVDHFESFLDSQTRACAAVEIAEVETERSGAQIPLHRSAQADGSRSQPRGLDRPASPLVTPATFRHL